MGTLSSLFVLHYKIIFCILQRILYNNEFLVFFYQYNVFYESLCQKPNKTNPLTELQHSFFFCLQGKVSFLLLFTSTGEVKQDKNGALTLTELFDHHLTLTRVKCSLMPVCVFSVIKHSNKKCV